MPTSPTLWRNAFFASTAGLAASCALWLARPAPVAPPPPPAPAPTPPPPSPTASAPTDAACCPALDKCRGENWSVLVRALVGESARTPDAGAIAQVAEVDAGSSTGADAQQHVLDEMARAHLRQQLMAARGLVYALIQNVGTEAWTKQWVVDEVNRMNPELNLDATSRRRLSEGFESLWASRGPTFQRALRENPPNGRALHDAVTDFFHAQDDLVEHVLGGEARDKYRAMELTSRTALAAVSATLADAPWDDSIVW